MLLHQQESPTFLRFRRWVKRFEDFEYVAVGIYKHTFCSSARQFVSSLENDNPIGIQIIKLGTSRYLCENFFKAKAIFLSVHLIEVHNFDVDNVS